MFSQRSMNTEKSTIIRCANCGANNRLDSSKLAQNFQPVCGRCQQLLQTPTTSTSSAHPITITDGNFSTVVEKSNLPVLLDLWAPWCSPCRMLTPIIEQLASELAGKVKVAKLNIDENPMTAARFGIQSIPTLLIFKNGQIIYRIVGAQPKQEILRKLNSIC